MTHTGYNQEDSILFNKGSVDRGLFQATIYHTEKDEDKKIHGDEEIRCKPDTSKTKGMKFANYNKLNRKVLFLKILRLKIKILFLAKLFPLKKIEMIIQKLLNIKIKVDHTKLMKRHMSTKIILTEMEMVIHLQKLEFEHIENQ